MADHEIDSSNAVPDHLVVDRSESYPVPAFTGSPTVTLSVAYPDSSAPTRQADDRPHRCTRRRWYATTYDGNLPDLMRDWIGIDPRAASGGNGTGADTTMTFTLRRHPRRAPTNTAATTTTSPTMRRHLQNRLTDDHPVNGARPPSQLGTFRMTHSTRQRAYPPSPNPGTGNPPVGPALGHRVPLHLNGNDEVVITYLSTENDSLFNSFVAVNAIEVTPAIDTDNDGIPDSGTSTRARTTPASDRCRHRHLTDLQEFHLGTDPDDPDTDGDGFNDDVETHNDVVRVRLRHRLQPLHRQFGWRCGRRRLGSRAGSDPNNAELAARAVPVHRRRIR